MSATTLFPHGARRSLVQQQVLRLAKRHQILFALLAATLPVMIAAGVSGRSDKLGDFVAQVTFFGAIALGVSLMGGVVSDDLRSGTVLLWYQRPGELRHWYLRRYADLQLMLMALCGLLSVSASLIAIIWAGMEPTRMFVLVLVTGLSAMIPAAMVFAYSAWGLARDGMAAVLTIMASIGLGVQFVFDDRPVAFFIRSLAFPIDSMQVISNGGGAFSVSTAVTIVLAHVIGWSLLGVLGLRLLPSRLASRMTGE